MTRGAARIGAVMLAVAALAALGQLQPGGRMEGFRIPDYDDDGTLRSQLFGDHAAMVSPDLIELQNVKVEFYRGGEVETRITSPHCVYHRRTGVAQSTSTVRIVRGGAVITGHHYRYDHRQQRFMILTNARVVLRDVRRSLPADLRAAAGGTGGGP